MRIGVDMARVSQIAHSLSISRKLGSRVFGRAERENAAQMPLRRSYEFLAGWIAVREAVLKAMSARLTGTVSLCDIETNNGQDGSPEVHQHASALSASQLLGISRWMASISHENDLAVAIVIAQ
jgi:holo-[acyl-carrier protein] synthase